MLPTDTTTEISRDAQRHPTTLSAVTAAHCLPSVPGSHGAGVGRSGSHGPRRLHLSARQRTRPAPTVRAAKRPLASDGGHRLGLRAVPTQPWTDRPGLPRGDGFLNRYETPTQCDRGFNVG